jgi:hypothetical protein
MTAELRTLLARCLHLGAMVAVLWGLLLYPAYRIGGSDAVFGLSVSAGLCLVPGWVVFLIASRFLDAASQMPIVVIGGSVLRLVFVLLGVLVVQGMWEGLTFTEFVVWLLLFYMATLAVETRLMLKGIAAAKDVPSADATEAAK